MLNSSTDHERFKVYTQTLPWNQILSILHKSRYFFLLYALCFLGHLQSKTHKQEENSFGTNPEFRSPSPHDDLYKIAQLTFTSRRSHVANSSPTIEDWFDDLPVGRRNKITFYGGGAESDDFIVTISPTIGDNREAVLVTVVEDPNSSREPLGFNLTTYALQNIRDLADTTWLAKTVYFLVLRQGNVMNSGVKAFADWYTFDLNPPLRRLTTVPRSSRKNEPIMRHGIIRQAINYAPLLSGPTTRSTSEVKSVLHVNKVGVRNANLDFVAQTLSAVGGAIIPIEVSISKEINNTPEDLALPHVYLNHLLIDAVTLQLTGAPDHAQKTALFRAGQRVLRGCNELILSFHHLTSQYWLDPKHSFVSGRYTPYAFDANEMLLPLIFILVALIVEAIGPVYVSPVPDHDFRVWLHRHEFFSPLRPEMLLKELRPTPPGGSGVVEQEVKSRRQEGETQHESELKLGHRYSKEEKYYMLLGDWVSGYLAITTVTAGATSALWWLADCGTKLFVLTQSRVHTDWIYLVYMTGMIICGLTVYVGFFTGYDVVARRFREKDAVVPRSLWEIVRLYAQIATKTSGLPMIALLYQLVVSASLHTQTHTQFILSQGLQPALGLLCAILISVTWLLPAPLDWAVMLGLILSGNSINFPSFWRFLQNTLRPYIYGLTGQETLKVFNSLVCVIVISVLRSLSKLVFDSPQSLIKAASRERPSVSTPVSPPS